MQCISKLILSFNENYIYIFFVCKQTFTKESKDLDICRYKLTGNATTTKRYKEKRKIQHFIDTAATWNNQAIMSISFLVGSA